MALSPREFGLLASLAQDPGAVHSRQQIMDSVWDPRFFGPTKTLDAHRENIEKRNLARARAGVRRRHRRSRRGRRFGSLRAGRGTAALLIPAPRCSGPVPAVREPGQGRAARILSAAACTPGVAAT
ncbi:winged helix-turn-helix domain-containing protein [Streptomyces sp. GMR22]|uniref:winged helix-turn-helix domain-containing protein n=1 Tax=Streptomyces sp. GMR22 TaxID=2759524 RepID=UPI003FA344FC